MTNYTATDRFLGRCDSCMWPIEDEVADYFGDYYRVTCPQCGDAVKLERLYGYATADPCAGECMGAIGKSCSCSCGGRNHGGLYFETGEALASAVEKAAKVAADEATYQADNADVLAKLAAYAGSNDFLLDLARQAG